MNNWTLAQLRDAAADNDPQMADCDNAELAAQIGTGNILAISGGRVLSRRSGITMPVSAGYSVTVDLAGDDTYTVRRVFVRAGKRWVKGEITGVYAEQVGLIAYRASCFRNVDFGDHAAA